ncbi:MAG: cyclic nucleotide-binding domain-containing protein, partial [Rhodospirillales bacterium]|nr:cyclic nucleotide-binding domain-containing protein [Rhodospirillales bacterium]
VKSLIDAANEETDEGVRSFVVRRAIAGKMAKFGDWEGKLVALLELAEAATGADEISVLDEAIAEIFDGSAAVMEILGYQRDVATAMQTIISICAGSYSVEGVTDLPLQRLSVLMVKQPLKWTQKMMMERLVRSLAGVQPLTKGTRENEKEAFRYIIRAVMGNRFFVNAGALCEAATLRAKSVLREEFEDESFEKAIDNLIFLLPTIAVKMGYLLDLCATESGAKAQDHVIACIANLLAGVTSVTQLVGDGASREEIIRGAAGLRDRLLQTGLPEEWRQRFARRIYELLISHQDGETQTRISAAAKNAPADAAPKVDAPATKGKSDAPLGREEYGEGDVIFREGDAGDAAYLILSGRVDILKYAGDSQIVIATVGKGGIVGEMALIDDKPRMATALAAVKTMVTVIPSKELQVRMDRLQKFDPVLRRLMGMMVERMRATSFTSVDS